MATTISRTWYDTLQDDSGSGTDGSVWDKADVDALLDAIDALLAANLALGGTLTITGALSGVTGVTVASGTIAASTPIVTGTQTWNDGATTFTGLRLNVTDTASAAASNLIDLLVGGSSKFKVQKDGAVTAVGVNSDTISEKTAAAGVTVDGVLLKDGAVTGQLVTPQTTTSTGAQANFSLSGRNVYLRCTGAAPEFSGFTVNGATPSDGDRVRIVCLGTTAKVTTEGAGSTAANRIICPSTTGQIVGLNGVMDLSYDGTTGRWRESLVDTGARIVVAHNAADFTANGSMTWTVEAADLNHFEYVQRGNVVTVWLRIADSTVGGTLNNELRIAFPGGFTLTSTTALTPVYMFNGTTTIGLFIAASNTITLYKNTGLDNYVASTNATNTGMPGVEFRVN